MAKDLSIGLNIDATGAQRVVDQFFKDVESDAEGARRALNQALGGSWEVRTKIIFEDDGSGKKVAKVIREDIATAADEVIRKYNEANKVQKGSLTNLRQAYNQAKQARDQISAIADATDMWRSKTASVNQQWAAANNKVQVLQKALDVAGASNFWDRLRVQFNFNQFANLADGVSRTVNAFQSIAIVIQQATAYVSQFFEATKKLQAIGLTFESIGFGANGAATALAEASRISLGLGVDLRSVRDSFQQLTPAITNSGGTLQDVSNITQALSSRFAAFGKSADESKRIIMAVTQAFGKGKLMAEELNQQISEADPAFRTDLAGALGVSVEALGEMVKNGEITSDVLIKTIPLLDKSSVLFGKLGDSALDAVLSLSNGNATLAQVEAKINAINQLTLESFASQFKSLMGVIIGLQAVFTDFFSELSKAKIIESISDVLGSVGATMLVVLDVVLQFTAAIVKALDPVASLVNAILDWKPAFYVVGTALAALATVQLAQLVASSMASGAALMAQVGAYFANTGAVIANTVAKAAAVGATTANTGATAANASATAADTAAETANTGAVAASTVALGAQTAALGANTTAQMANSAASNGLLEITELLPKSLLEGVGGLGELGSALQGSGKGLTDAGGKAAKFGDNIVDLFKKDIKVKDMLKGTGAGLSKAWEGVTEAVGKAASGLMEFLPLIGTVGLAVGAIAAVGLAWDVYSKTQEAASKTTEFYNNSAKQTNSIINQQKTSLDSSKAAFDSAAARVGKFSATIDSLKNKFQSLPPGVKNIIQTLFPLSNILNTTTAEARSWGDQMNATADGGDKLIAASKGLVTNFSTLVSQSDKSEASIAKINAAYQASNKDILSNIEALKQKIAATEQEKTTNEESEQIKAGVIASMKEQIVQLYGVKAALDAEAQAQGIATIAASTYIDMMKEKLKIMQDNKKLIEDLAKPKIDEEKARFEEEKKQLDEIKQKRQDAHNTEMDQIRDAEESQRDKYNKESRLISENNRKSQQKYDKEIQKLRAVKDQITKTYEQQITPLEGDTPAEAALARLQEQELRKQASQGETPEDRLRAQAQLERMAVEKQIAALKAQQQKEEQAAQAAIDAKEKARAEEEEAEKEAERKRQEAHQDKMDKLSDQARKKEREWKAEEKSLNDEIQKKKEAHEQKIVELKKPIKEMEDLILEAKKEIAGVTNEQAGNEQKIYDLIKQQRIELDKIQKLRSKQNTEAGTSAAPKPPAVQAPPQGSIKLPGRFTGGPVSAGASYAVNELGQEAFLSASGRLSKINVPSFGRWQAPSSGTVIPAHLTAGLNIPPGGVSLNTKSASVAVSSASAARSSDPVARALMAIANASNGPVTNNVTIQSENPTQSASDMMVTMARIKRRRYS